MTLHTNGPNGLFDRSTQGYRAYLLVSQSFLAFSSILSLLLILFSNSSSASIFEFIMLAGEVLCMIVAYSRQREGQATAFGIHFETNWKVWRLELIFVIASFLIALIIPFLLTPASFIMNVIIGFQSISLLKIIFSTQAEPENSEFTQTKEPTTEHAVQDKFVVLGKLNELKRQGILSEEEYNEEKKKILG